MKKTYVLFLELIKEKEMMGKESYKEHLYLKDSLNNNFIIYAECTECGRAELSRGLIELPMETFGSENRRSVKIEINIPMWRMGKGKKNKRKF